MYTIERKSEIMNLLEKEGKVDVAELSKQFGISRETARRDLRELEKEGVLTRTHGGAVLESHILRAGEYPVAVREIQRYREKCSICMKAVSYLKDGDLVFVDNSSTTHYLPRFLPRDLRVTVLTNSINLLLEASKHDSKNHTYLCAGGLFKGRNLSLFGSITTNTIGAFYPDKIFMSCAGISLKDDVITDSSIDEVDAKKMMVKQSREVFVLADYTKWGKKKQVFISSLDDVNVIITDSLSHNVDLTALESKNIIVDFA